MYKDIYLKCALMEGSDYSMKDFNEECEYYLRKESDVTPAMWVTAARHVYSDVEHEWKLRQEEEEQKAWERANAFFDVGDVRDIPYG